MLSLAHSKVVFGFNNTILGDKAVFGFKKSRRRNGILKALEKDNSELEIERDKARQALRKLDDQLQSLSNKQASSPKIRAEDFKQTSLRGKEEASKEITGSFLSYTASFLLIFTLLYNVIFLTVIKPAVDGSETLQYTDAKNEVPQELQLGP